MNYIEITSFIVIVTTILKTVYDLALTDYFYEQGEKKKQTTLELVKAKKFRDKISTIIVFGIVISASILSLRDSVMTDSVSREEFDLLVKRVQKLESPLIVADSGPNGVSPDSGGATQLADILDDLYKKLNDVNNNFVTQNEFKKIVKEIAELKPNETSEGVVVKVKKAEVIFDSSGQPAENSKAIETGK